MRLLLTSFTGRCLANWLPLTEEAARRGGRCDIAVFPRLCDPDHRNLLGTEISPRYRANIDDSFGFTDESAASAMDRFCTLVAAECYDAILLTSCVAGPELQLREALRKAGLTTPAIGLQHGVVQSWDVYHDHQNSFDGFGLFGPAFIEKFSDNFQPKVFVFGLPKLDKITPRSPAGRITLFALQSMLDVDQVYSITRDLEARGCTVVLRSHPEHETLYAELAGRLNFLPPNESANAALGRVDRVVTTGSTLVLEALAAKLPTAVLPAQGGEVYNRFGIVAESVTAEAALAVMKKYADHTFQLDLNRSLEQFAGIGGKRTESAFIALETAIRTLNLCNNK